jgi:hypothetical protein
VRVSPIVISAVTRILRIMMFGSVNQRYQIDVL